jgi:hypothetical protein
VLDVGIDRSRNKSCLGSDRHRNWVEWKVERSAGVLLVTLPTGEVGEY